MHYLEFRTEEANMSAGERTWCIYERCQIKNIFKKGLPTYALLGLSIQRSHPRQFIPRGDKFEGEIMSTET